MKTLVALATSMLACTAVSDAWSHGFAGKRFFPATLATDDPFVADELSLPLVSQRKLAASDDSPATTQTATSVDFTKRITQNFGVGFSANYLRFRDEAGAVTKGFDNFAASLKYQFYKNDEHEAIASVGLDSDIAHTGAKAIGESFTTFTPGIFVGKGLGDLPESLRYLRPLAVTGVAGVSVPSRRSDTLVDDSGNVSVQQHPDVLNLGFAIEYSIPYLQSFVKDVGLGEPFNRMIPVVEVAMQKPVDRGASGFTGTVNPGVIWADRYMQFALEAILPANSRTGGGKGAMFQIHFFIDDLFPRSLGRPIL